MWQKLFSSSVLCNIIYFLCWCELVMWSYILCLCCCFLINTDIHLTYWLYWSLCAGNTVSHNRRLVDKVHEHFYVSNWWLIFLFLPILPSSGWNHVVWVGQAGSLSAGLQASVFPVGGRSATQSPVPVRPGVRFLVLRWERAVQDLQVCVFLFMCICMPDPIVSVSGMTLWQDDWSANECVFL